LSCRRSTTALDGLRQWIEAIVAVPEGDFLSRSARLVKGVEVVGVDGIVGEVFVWCDESRTAAKSRGLLTIDRC